MAYPHTVLIFLTSFYKIKNNAVLRNKRTYCAKVTLIRNRFKFLNLDTKIEARMEGITIIDSKVNKHRLMQIDLDVVSGDEESIEDLYDLIAIELRKKEELIPWEQAKKRLDTK